MQTQQLRCHLNQMSSNSILVIEQCEKDNHNPHQKKQACLQQTLMQFNDYFMAEMNYKQVCLKTRTDFEREKKNLGCCLQKVSTYDEILIQGRKLER